IDASNRHREQFGKQWTHNTAGADARSNESEHPPRLIACKDIDAEAPEHGQYEQVEHGEPNEERARNPSVVFLKVEPHPERAEVENKEAVDPRKKGCAPIARCHETIDRLYREHR